MAFEKVLMLDGKSLRTLRAIVASLSLTLACTHAPTEPTSPQRSTPPASSHASVPTRDSQAATSEAEQAPPTTPAPSNPEIPTEVRLGSVAGDRELVVTFDSASCDREADGPRSLELVI